MQFVRKFDKVVPWTPRAQRLALLYRHIGVQAEYVLDEAVPSEIDGIFLTSIVSL